MRFLSDEFFTTSPEIYRANGDATGALAGLNLTAFQATASGSGSPASGSGALAAINVTPFQATASTTASPGNATGAFASINITPFQATAVGAVFIMPTSASPFKAEVVEDSIKVLARWKKQPADAQDFDISYVTYLADFSDAAAGVVVTTDTGITLLGYSLVAGVVKVLLSGGTDGMKYKITLTLTTTAGRTKQAEFYVRVKET